MADTDSRWVALGILGACALVAPYLADAVGLELDVAASVEIVDHVVPGVTVLIASAAMIGRGRRTSTQLAAAMAATGLAMLAGLWITTSHAPLAVDALRGSAPLAASLVHIAVGPPVLALALWLLADVYRSAATS